MSNFKIVGLVHMFAIGMPFKLHTYFDSGLLLHAFGSKLYL